MRLLPNPSLPLTLTTPARSLTQIWIDSVIQRQSHLHHTTGLTLATAYDTARRELYALRHSREIETRVAREEAQHLGSYFSAGPLEWGMKLEDQQYEAWRSWAQKEILALKQLQGSAYTGVEVEEGSTAGGGGEEGAELGAGIEEVGGSVPGSKEGQGARGGAVVHP